MFLLFAVWPADDPTSSETCERVRLFSALPEQLGDACARALRETSVIQAGLEVRRSSR